MRFQNMNCKAQGASLLRDETCAAWFERLDKDCCNILSQVMSAQNRRRIWVLFVAAIPFILVCAGNAFDTGVTGDGGGSIQAPTTLEVQYDTMVINVGYAGCSDNVYGVELGVHYQVLDQNNIPIHSPYMEPQEKVTNWVANGTSLGDPIPNWQDIGPSGYPPANQFTDSNGRFWDGPVGYCFNVPVATTFVQQISVLLFGTRYTVRTNNWSGQSSAQFHGSITNNNDISGSR